MYCNDWGCLIHGVWFLFTGIAGIFLALSSGDIGKDILKDIGCFALLIMMITGGGYIVWLSLGKTPPKTSNDYSPPLPPPQPPKPPAPCRQNITSTDTTISQNIDTFCTSKGDVHQLIDSASVVYDEVTYCNEYQEELDNFLAHGVIPGVEVNTENCKKAFGMMYELFVGREFEKNNYSVQYNGIENGKKDCGIDLAVYKSRNEVILVQCKYWRDSLIDCDVVSRMCGARELYLYQWLQRYSIPSCKLSCLIVTSSKLTEEAKKFAHCQSIDFVEEKTMDPHSIPWVKGGKVSDKFYLPWDKNYTKFKQNTEFYKISDAVKYGFKIRGNESDTPGIIICYNTID